MTRPAGLILIAASLFILGVRLLGADSDHDGSLTLRLTQLVVGLASVVAGYAIWNVRPYALTTYWGWMVTWLAAGVVVAYAVKGEPLLHVLIWVGFTGAMWIAVGLYVKSALGRVAT